MSVSVMGPAADGAAASQRVREWALYYVWRRGWAVAPCWLPASAVPGGAEEGCACPEGENCPWPGKHLVDDRGADRVVRTAGAVEGNGEGEADRAAVAEAWPAEHPDVARGKWGAALLAGSESAVLVWDAPRGVDMPAGWLGGGEGSLVAVTPSGGRHWFFQLDKGEAVAAGGGGLAGVGGKVLADGAYVVLHPHPGYSWVGAGIAPAEVPSGMRLVLTGAGVLLAGLTDDHADDPWRCAAGAGLAGTVGRTLSRTGDVRRFVDGWGHLVRVTPGLGWAAWTPRGWVWDEAAELEITRMVQHDLVAAVRREGQRATAGGRDAEAQAANAHAVRMLGRSRSFLKGDLEGDPRVQVRGAEAWDADGAVAGLPVLDGVGRMVELATGKVVGGAREKLVSRTLVVAPGGGGGAGGGKMLRKYLGDLQEVHGEGFVRLLKRAMGATLYGGGALEAECRRRGVRLVGGTDFVIVLGGQSRSGKTTAMEALAGVMGDYAKPMIASLLFGGGNSGSDTAGVRGARMLYMSEPPEGGRLNVPLLKALSGGDSMTGRKAYGKSEVSFRPEATVWVATNHPLGHTDDALWERLKIFTFRTDWAGKKGDAGVRAALTGDRGEQAAFLGWVLEGAREVVSEGWGDTEEWDSSVAAEKAGADPLARFIEEGLVVGPAAAGGEMALETVMSMFGTWWAIEGEGAEKLAMTRAQIRKEFENRLVRMGAVMKGKKGPLVHVTRVGGRA